MAENAKDELDDLEEEEELEPEGCMGIGWGTLLMLALIVILAGLAVMGSWRLAAVQQEQVELEMMRNQAFQISLGSVVKDLTSARDALAANNPDEALKSLTAAHRGLGTAFGQASEESRGLVVTVTESSTKTQKNIKDRLREASQEAQADVESLVENVKRLRGAP